jgi:hypothetical protein
LYNFRVGKRFDSAPLKATGTDSLSDCVSTLVILIATLVGHFTEFQIDGFCGVAVALLIFVAGINAAKDTLVTLSGCEIVSNGASPIDISGGMMTTVTGCNITRIAEGHSADPININGGLGVTVVGNTICTQANAATIGSAFKGGANITGNTIVTSAKAQSDVFRINAKNATINTANNVVLYEHSYK